MFLTLMYLNFDTLIELADFKETVADCSRL